MYNQTTGMARLSTSYLSIKYSESVVMTKGSVRGWSKSHFFVRIKHIMVRRHLCYSFKSDYPGHATDFGENNREHYILVHQGYTVVRK